MKKNYLPIFLYATLALLVMGSLLKPGYLLMLDITRLLEGPVNCQLAWFGLSEGFCRGLPYWLTAHSMNLLLPQWVTQKIFFFLALFLAGMGAHRLCPSKWSLGKYFAGMLYMINPFVYVRLLAGQFGFVLTYALIPFVIYYFIATLENKDRKSPILTAVFLTVISVFTPHGTLLALFALLVIFIAKIVQKRRDAGYLIGITKRIGLSAIIFLLLNVYWLTSLQTLSGLSQIGELDVSLFAPRPTSDLSVGFSVLTMYGFWRGGYIYATDIFPGWWLISMFILFLATYGFVSRFSDEKYGIYIRSIGIIGILGLVLAIGSSLEVTKPMFHFLWDHLLFFRGFRDSQKFVALIALAYSFLGGLGLAGLAQGWRQGSKKRRGVTLAVVVLALLLPITNCFTIFNGLWGQIKPIDYPQEWYEVNHYLNQDSDDFNILFLPWHGWMDFNWIPNRDKRLANPARHFFDKPIIQGDTIEGGGIYTQSTNPISNYMDFVLSNANSMSNLGELLAPLNVKYVLLVHEADYTDYDFLYQQEDLVVDLEKPGLTLFKNEHPTTRAYGVESVVYINSLGEYLELSKTQDVMTHLYVLGSGPSDDGNTRMEKLTVIEKNPVKYRITNGSQSYVVFTVPQNVSTQYWEYNDDKPLFQNLGFMPAFTSSFDEGEVVYTRFYYVYLPSYIISVIAVGFMVYFYFRCSKQKRL